MPGQNFDSKRRITVRNLRIREDTAKVRDAAQLHNTERLVYLDYVWLLLRFPVKAVDQSES